MRNVGLSGPVPLPGRTAPRRLSLRYSSSSLLLSSLELSDTKVYEPSIRARLGTAAHFCGVVVLADTLAPRRISFRNKTESGVHRKQWRARLVDESRASPHRLAFGERRCFLSLNAGFGESTPPLSKRQCCFLSSNASRCCGARDSSTNIACRGGFRGGNTQRTPLAVAWAGRLPRLLPEPANRLGFVPEQ